MDIILSQTLRSAGAFVLRKLAYSESHVQAPGYLSAYRLSSSPFIAVIAVALIVGFLGYVFRRIRDDGQ